MTEPREVLRWMADVYATEEGRRLIDRERVWVEATETLCIVMEEQGVTGAELARRLGVSPAWISQMLSGERNLTLGTLSDAFHVLGRSLHVTHGPLTDRPKILSPSTRKRAKAKSRR